MLSKPFIAGHCHAPVESAWPFAPTPNPEDEPKDCQCLLI
jgi:hypothetical protein